VCYTQVVIVEDKITFMFYSVLRRVPCLIQFAMYKFLKLRSSESTHLHASCFMFCSCIL